MAYARAYAGAARTAYQRALDSEVQAGQTLSTGLIGLGGVIAALATGRVHRDVLVGAGLVGGTAYAIGNWNISRQRQLVYIAGVEGINCAVRAVAAFDMPELERQALQKALAGLEASLLEAARAANDLSAKQALVDVIAATRALHAEADAVAADGRAATAAGREVLVGGMQISTKIYRAGGELISAVDRIGAAIDKAVLDTIPDLTAVPKVVSGLAGFAGSMAPGSGLEGRISQMLKDAGASSQGRLQRTDGATGRAATELRIAIANLRAATESLVTAASQVRSRTVSFDPAATTASLADCGITVSSALAATPATVTLKGGTDETYSIILAGGTKPYVVQLQGAAPKAGLTVRGPAPFDSAIIITATPALTGKQSFSILAMDASNPPKAVEVLVSVSGTTGVAGEPSTQPTASALMLALNKLSGFDVDGTKVSIKPPIETLGDGKLKVTIACEPARTSPLSQNAVVTALLGQTGADGTKIGELLTSTPAEAFVVTGDAKCIATSAAQGRLQRISLSPAEISMRESVRGWQKKLCLSGRQADGIWGPNSQAALERWRKKTGSKNVAVTVTDEERRTIAGADDAVVATWCKAP